MTATTDAQANLVDELDIALGAAPWAFDDSSACHTGRAVSVHRTICGIRIKIVGCVEHPGWCWYAATDRDVLAPRDVFAAGCSDTATGAVAALQDFVPVSITA